MRELLGGKGANVAEMTRVARRRSRAGRLHDHHRGLRGLHARPGAPSPRASTSRSADALARLEEQPASGSATPRTRCWSRCARGARESMPGMLDTVLNLGLNDASVAGPGAGDRQRALRLGLLPALRADVRQRRARHPGRALRGRDRGGQARRAGSKHDTELDVDDAAASSVTAFKRIFATQTGEEFPQDPREQLQPGDPGGVRLLARRPRGRVPALNRIPDDWGTAVNVQQMVFGNKGDTVGLGGRVLARRGHRRARALRRLPAQRAGRGRRVGRPHAARPRASWRT